MRLGRHRGSPITPRKTGSTRPRSSSPRCVAGWCLLDVWTFDCWNCYRSIPWLNAVEKEYASEGLSLIGVHSPELDHERVRSAVERKVKEFGIAHPVMLDNDFSYWNALNNRYWPAYYLIDRRGRIRAYYVGEMHAGQARARAVEAKLKELLREPE